MQENKLNNTGAEDELLTVSDAAKLLKLSVVIIYTKVWRKEIPANKQGDVFIFIVKNYWSGSNPAVLELSQKCSEVLDQILVLNNRVGRVLCL